MRGDSNLLTLCLREISSSTSLIALHEGKYYSLGEFQAAVAYWAEHFQACPEQRYAIYAESAYPFAVLLFALFHAGKEVWIPGNNRPGTARLLKEQGCRLAGEWLGDQYVTFDVNASRMNITLKTLHPDETRLVIFSSGSNGEPKPIPKSLFQLTREVAVLEKLWGQRLGNSHVLSTVSHQHIYGLLFRILWPLSFGRCFHSEIYLNPEILANHIGTNPCCWIASPAHLKRLDNDSPWRTLSKLIAIFSSGGVLTEQATQQISQNAAQYVLEVYGSSETGGVAWRAGVPSWTLFPDMALTAAAESWQLHSPYLPGDRPYLLDDKLSVLDDGRFILQGRADRIVKIEEKRLSLSEMEQRLLALPFVKEAYVMSISKNREIVAAVLALTPEGIEIINKQGRAGVIKMLQAELKLYFDLIVLPRKWLFVDSIPLTSQGKIDQNLLNSLMKGDNKKFPRVLGIKIANDRVDLQLKVPNEQELIYFPDHFAGHPILPGVIQLAWVAYFGNLFFNIDAPSTSFSHLEVVKFIKIISPDEILKLSLNWKAVVGELGFIYNSEHGTCSSGRMIYTLPEKACSL